MMEMRGDELFVRAQPARRVLRGAGDRPPWKRSRSEASWSSAAAAPAGGNWSSAGGHWSSAPGGQAGGNRSSAVAAVAAAVRELALDIRMTTDHDEEWKRRHFKELQKKWHPDKNPDRLEQATAVFQHLMKLKEWYLMPH